MGYTNYWDQLKPFNNKEWNIIKKEYEYIKDNFSDDEGIIEDQTEKSDEIIFNGKSKNNLDHETFVFDEETIDKSSWESNNCCCR